MLPAALATASPGYYHMAHSMRYRLIPFAMVALTVWALHAQLPATTQTPKPAPRLANGRVDFTGVWRPGDIFLIEDISLGLKKGDTISLTPVSPPNKASEEPFVEGRSGNELSSDWRPAPRALSVEDHRISAVRVYFPSVENIHSYLCRFFMDGRKQFYNLNPSWYGHSVGYRKQVTRRT